MSGGDVHIVTGMDAIINPDNIKPGIDLKELERRMISGGLLQQQVRDPQDRFNDELTDAAKKLGISFGEFSKDKRGGNPQNSSKPLAARPSFALPEVSLDDGFISAKSPPSEESKEESEEESDEENGGSGEPQPTGFNNIKSPPPVSIGHSGYDSGNRFSSGGDRFRFGGDLRSRTQEQERRAHIDSVMGSNDGTANFSFEKEKREDMKCAMLAEIDSLMSSLAEEDTDLTRIPRVDRNSPYEEVESVLKMLRHKNDHTRYCSFAEEFLLFGAYALEELFDGERTWFGRYRPDLTGWHNHVNVKTKRMRHDTGQLVSGVMQDYNIGPGARVLLELVPSMVLYSKMRKKQHSQPGLFNDEEMAQANNRIREAT